MRSHLKDTVAEISADYSLLFREMFCVSAQALADSMSLPLENLGIAYDQILETGVVRSRRQRQVSSTSTTRSLNLSYGRGQFLFLVKHASKSEVSHLMSSGYRFTEPNNVVGLIARAMQITRTEADTQLKKMRDYYGPQSAFSSGVHIGFFGMRPNVQKGFNVVVRDDQSHVIPSLQLPITHLTEEQKDFMMSFAGKSVEEILNELRVPQAHKLDYDMLAFRYYVQITTLISDLNFMGPLYLSRKRSRNLPLWTPFSYRKRSSSP